MFCPFQKYKSSLGEPNKGVHSYRFLDTAIVDYILSIILAAIITVIFKIPFVLTTIFILTLSIVLHTLFGVKTTVSKYLGIHCD